MEIKLPARVGHADDGRCPESPIRIRRDGDGRRVAGQPATASRSDARRPWRGPASQLGGTDGRGGFGEESDCCPDATPGVRAMQSRRRNRPSAWQGSPRS